MKVEFKSEKRGRPAEGALLAHVRQLHSEKCLGCLRVVHNDVASHKDLGRVSLVGASDEDVACQQRHLCRLQDHERVSSPFLQL